MERFSIMERRMIAGSIQVVVMDWIEEQVLTISLDHSDSDETLPEELITYLDRITPILNQPYWKSKLNQFP